MSINARNVSQLVAMIAFKEALDTQIEILENEIFENRNDELKKLLTEELLRVTNENLSASRDILRMARLCNLQVTWDQEWYGKHTVLIKIIKIFGSGYRYPDSIMPLENIEQADMVAIDRNEIFEFKQNETLNLSLWSAAWFSKAKRLYFAEVEKRNSDLSYRLALVNFLNGIDEVSSDLVKIRA